MRRKTYLCKYDRYPYLLPTGTDIRCYQLIGIPVLNMRPMFLNVKVVNADDHQKLSGR